MKDLKELVALMAGLASIALIFIGAAALADIVDYNPRINLAGIGMLSLGICIFLRHNRILDWAYKE